MDDDGVYFSLCYYTVLQTLTSTSNCNTGNKIEI